VSQMRGRDIAGRKAIVTGAASGIGAAAVARLMDDGCVVLAVDRVAEGLAGTHNLTADLSEEGAFAAIAEAAEAKLGGCDILINNAGVCPAGPFDEMTDDMWNAALSINVTAAMKLTRALLPMLRASKAGRVINTGSIMSRFSNPGLVAYVTSEHAILGLTRSLAMELGADGITVNGMTKDVFDANAEFRDYYVTQSALGRLGQPEDIADVMAFLATDDARFVTGQGIMVDGGVTVHG
jgi:3-oxoacyl-[acyl-carrier protein] reductase